MEEMSFDDDESDAEEEASSFTMMILRQCCQDCGKSTGKRLPAPEELRW
jgi:hypothetical protein